MKENKQKTTEVMVYIDRYLVWSLSKGSHNYDGFADFSRLAEVKRILIEASKTIGSVKKVGKGTKI